MSMKEHILRLHAEGKNYTQIKNELGCSKGTISYHLGAGQKLKTLERTRDRRSKIRKLIQDIKQNTPCNDCFESYPYWIMEFDHLGNKSFTVSKFQDVTGDIEVVMGEIMKCEVVCSNCHKNRTHTRSLKNNSNGLNSSEYYEDLMN